MKHFINILLRPSKEVLTVYGLFSLIFLIGYVWLFSFVWEYYSSVTYYVLGLLVVLLIGVLATEEIDKRYQGQLKLYFRISFLQLLLIWIIANPIRSWQIESSLQKAKRITNSLSLYKKRFGVYPFTLAELEERLKEDLPTRSNLGTQYWYKLTENNQEYELKFLSYYGNTAYYNPYQDKWLITD
ncbi:hypothetical protein GXP67_13330 [Rhodocytophaga rosea]|uniref:Uncharacterized protein n=1 Tax=Rhodocytophaga rosea TaxID=2704465 RepID=A0A6C0GHR2_9BACT|nr:hypothetical protein [Rhodocytophaga rosea]QHT67538.1 hypothetical protein GXP67_13330 [Rhodocytophaga rosea]